MLGKGVHVPVAMNVPKEYSVHREYFREGQFEQLNESDQGVKEREVGVHPGTGDLLEEMVR